MEWYVCVAHLLSLFIESLPDLVLLGVVELTDLRIKKELLDSLVLPIAIKMGTTQNKFWRFLRLVFQP